MKHIRNLLAAGAALCAVAVAFAQNAALKADSIALAPAGGTVQLTATATYEGQPGAIGWSIVLPKDWALVSVGGANVPAIAPDAGATGTLEFAYMTVPADRAEFTVVVRYPAGVKQASATGTALVRAAGKLVTAKAEPVQFSAP